MPRPILTKANSLQVARGLAHNFVATPSANRIPVLCGEAAGLLIAVIGSFLLRFDFAIPQHYVLHLKFACLVSPLAKMITFNQMGLQRGWWRYFSLQDLRRLVLGNVTASLICGVLILSFGPAGFPKSIYLLDLLLALLITAGGRAILRTFAEMGRGAAGTVGKRTLIYGAGDAGVILLREIRQNPALGYDIVGFVDDDPRKKRLSLAGVSVLGAGDSLPALVRSLNIEQVLIAIPSATGAQMTAILRSCQNVNLKYKTVPGFGELIEGAKLGRQIRPVALEDLLGRLPVQLDQQTIADRLRGEVVLVTGAAGSIGSELCRQIARFSPRLIVAFDLAETALFYLEKEFQEKFVYIEIVPEIGSIQDKVRLRELFGKYRPKAVFHAAAFKHVPLMENHAFEALQNNVLGTYFLAKTAEEFGVETFVLISTDKAVRPTNVMGASKRLAELVTVGLQDSATKFVAVRFGNVLGSNGSVIPVFQKQILEGGPVKVTHPDMRRYFMTIPEATQLVLQASVMGEGGEIFVLDMGELVRIEDLATNLILLSGLKPGEDIRIEFTGVRPGEKLYEEIQLDNESIRRTHHPRIKIFSGVRFSPSQVAGKIRAIERIVRQRDLALVVAFCQQNIPDYQPSTFILNQSKPEARSELAKVHKAVG
jgi:FlaA1/EpsC-like NDP-sugar epimerase